MNTLNKLLGLSLALALMAFVIPFVAFTQVKDLKTQSSPAIKPAEDTVKFDPVAFRNYVNLAIDKVTSIGKSKEKGLDIGSYANEFKIISENPQLEKVMDLSSVWFLDISKLLKEMSKYKTEMEVSEERGLKERLAIAKKLYEELGKKLKYQLDHPQKVGKK